MEGISFLHLTILALASYRLTHLVVYDVIMVPLRQYFVVREFGKGPDGRRIVYSTIQGQGFRNWLGRMINCPWCAGIWVAAAVTAGYWWLPVYAMWFYLFLAIAAIQSLIESTMINSSGVIFMPGPKPAEPQAVESKEPATS